MTEDKAFSLQNTAKRQVELKALLACSELCMPDLRWLKWFLVDAVLLKSGCYIGLSRVKSLL